MYKNPERLLQQHRYNKRMLDHNDDDEYQKNERVCIHEDVDDGHAMMR
jgi:hypothetical protein